MVLGEFQNLAPYTGRKPYCSPIYQVLTLTSDPYALGFQEVLTVVHIARLWRFAVLCGCWAEEAGGWDPQRAGASRSHCNGLAEFELQT